LNSLENGISTFDDVLFSYLKIDFKGSKILIPTHSKGRVLKVEKTHRFVDILILYGNSTIKNRLSFRFVLIIALFR
jgi:hypothetical protein